MEEHTNAIKKKFAARVWILRHLKKISLAPNKMTAVYMSMIRSQIEYGSVAYGTLLTNGQSAAIERLQSIALKTIWGWDKNYAECLELSGLERLDVRRANTLRTFAHKTCQNARFSSTWFPLNEETEHDLRRREKYKISFARHERLRRAPIHAMRRILNDDESDLATCGNDPDLSLIHI